MASQTSGSGNGSLSPGQSAGWTPPDTSATRLALDNLIRRELKIGDPNDPTQIANALMNRFQGSPRAQAIGLEARGLPFLHSAVPQPATPSAPTTVNAELQQAVDDVERDLNELLTNALLKDITPEIRGWAQGVRSAIREGTNAARFGLDPRQRDKAMALRRQLGDYARMARLVGALTPNVNAYYRSFAKSLDESAAVILVMIGESLANAGFSGGQFLLQVPYTELQVRRDAVLYALRNLVGSTQQAYGPSEWPRGIDAYRQLFASLEAQGQGDLRALLVENELMRTMDELIARSSHGQPEGLRAVGATAAIDLHRFRRLIAIGVNAVIPESPPLASFLNALSLFADAFDHGGGARLMRIARPPILLYGLYGMAGLTDADQRLIRLVSYRNQLAELLDCNLDCGCNEARVGCQIRLDKILYDTDRAIDLYAIGVTDFGEPERRATAYAYLIDAFEFRNDYVRNARGQWAARGQADPPSCIPPMARPPAPSRPVGRDQLPADNDRLGQALYRIKSELRPSLSLTDQEITDVIDHLTRLRDALRIAVAGEAAKHNPPAEIGVLNLEMHPPGGLPAIARDLGSLTDAFALCHRAYEVLARHAAITSALEDLMQAEAMDYLSIIRQELCAQERAEKRWRALVVTLSPSCQPAGTHLDAVATMITDAMTMIGGECEDDEIHIPTDRDTALDNIAHQTTPRGHGRGSRLYRT